MTKYIGKSNSTMRLALKELREVIENDPDPAVQRIAYGMETVLRWARTQTVNWQRPAAEARDVAKLLRKELDLPPYGDQDRHER